MHWNHRVVRYTVGEDTYYELAEVYYDEKDNYTGWCRAFLMCDDMEEMDQLVGRFETALTKPILDVDPISFEQEGCNHEEDR